MKSTDFPYARILLIEDEVHIRRFLRLSLEAHGFEVGEARLGEEGIALAAQNSPDLVILDLGLPDMDGQVVIRRLREWSNVPIIVLSVRSDEGEKVVALDSGANDYVTKPFGISELMARIRASVRARQGSEKEGVTHQFGDLQVDLARRKIIRGDMEIAVSRKEYMLLKLFVTHAGQVLTHRHILREIWGANHEEDTHYLRVLVAHLRQKLDEDLSRPRYIVTVQGVGYRFEAQS